jgi:hypothetical protein
MAIQLTCPHCSKRLAIKKPVPGNPVRCPICTGLVPVPDVIVEESSDTAAKPEWWQNHPDKPDMELEASQPRWHELLNWRMVGFAAGGSLALLFGVVATAAWVGRPTPAPVVIFEAAPVQLALAELDSRTAVQPAVEEPALDAALAPAAAEIAVPEEPEQRPVEVKKPAKPEKLQIVRRDRSSDEQLRRQLLKVPEATLGNDRTSREIVARANLLADGFVRHSSHFTPTLLANRADLRGLPFRMGDECQLGKEPADNMQEMSRKMRTLLARGVPNVDVLNANAPEKGEPNKWHEAWNEFSRREAIPCLMQMLQPEKRTIRQIMVKQLDSVDHRSASEALAKVALYDLADDMRAEALQALAKRPADEYRQVLLEAFRHPWPPVADHAAEALVALNDYSAVSALKLIAEQPDPAAPYYDSAQKTWMQPEMVRINHLHNCLMCHAPSKGTTDMVRGRIPDPSKPLPPLTQYYEDTTGIFVRADVTYLKQDFSVFQPVERPGQWPQMQRFDYIVRARRVDTYQELAALQQKKQPKDYPQRDAALFAIRELSR